MGIYVPPDETIYHWVDWDRDGRDRDRPHRYGAGVLVMAPEPSLLWRVFYWVVAWFVLACVLGGVWALVSTFFQGAKHVEPDPVPTPAASRLAAAVRLEPHRGAPVAALPDLPQEYAGLVISGTPHTHTSIRATSAARPFTGIDQFTAARRERLRLMQGGRR